MIEHGPVQKSAAAFAEKRVREGEVMRIVSTVLNGGEIPAKYGKHGDTKNDFGVPSISVPFEIQDAPEGTVCYALVLDDVDAVPVCGFTWIHWVAANIKKSVVPENDSVNADYPQGVNSWLQTYGKQGAVGYGGMTPPDAPHTYTLKVYALDAELPLENGFYLNELMHAMKGHILAQAEAEGVYNN